jgi:hypothetical protein
MMDPLANQLCVRRVSRHVNDHKTQMAQRRNGVGEDGLMDSRPMSCAWAAHLRSTRADILLDPRGTSRALRRIGSHSFCLAQLHSTVILLGPVLAHSGVVLSFAVPSLARSASAASPLFFSSFLSFSRAPALPLPACAGPCFFLIFAISAPYCSERPLQIARIALSDPESGAWRRTNSAENGTVLLLTIAPGTTRVGE